MSVKAITKDKQDAIALYTYLAPIQKLLDAEGVTEICINRPGEVWTEGNNGWEKHIIPEVDYSYCHQISMLVANYNDQAINRAAPMLSAVLPGNLRVQILIPPAVEKDTIGITIRRPSPTARTLEQYVDDGAFNKFLWGRPKNLDENINALEPNDKKLIEHLSNSNLYEFLVNAIKAKKNIAVVGDTGSGKTTLMKAMCNVIPDNERLITIEDVRELFLPQENRLHLLYSGTGQSVAKISPADLIRSCMRLKPDRVLLAELRGSEAFDFLNLLTTGHSGSITSFHAESCALAVERYAFMCKAHLDAQTYDDADIKHLVNLTIDVILHMTARNKYDEKGNFVGKDRFVTQVHFDPLAKIAAQLGSDRTIFRAKE